jgi:2-oxoglutarate dehydrogenase E2 component (dihydrolipoamide succinyltransferase)
MSQFEIVMPKLGESITEATITKWFKKENDQIEEDDVLLEIATDKVDSEIPSPVEGKIIKLLYKEGDVVPVGKVIAIISLDGSDAGGEAPVEPEAEPVKTEQQAETKQAEQPAKASESQKSSRFYSPLVKNIAKQENIPLEELEELPGSGQNGRLRKEDVIGYIENRSKGGAAKTQPQVEPKKETAEAPQAAPSEKPKVSVSVNAEDEIVEMDRMRRLIADHMVMSKQVAPHVTNFLEADVTNLVLWRNKIKDDFQAREKEKITFMPVFIEAAAKALKDFPQVNASVDGYKIILRKKVNIGVAVALPTGNLIVPVIKSADHLNLLGLSKEMNRLADSARNNKLGPDDIQGGTFTISNFGTFKNDMGTPIINQPQVAILATGNITKKPAVVETPTGDIIAVRHKMFLSLTYDHRVVDGALGGAFLRRIADYLENFDINRSI